MRGTCGGCSVRCISASCMYNFPYQKQSLKGHISYIGASGAKSVQLHHWGVLVQMVQQPPLGGCTIAPPLYFVASKMVQVNNGCFAPISNHAP